MADLKNKIESELENIDEVLYALPNHLDLPKLSKLEIAGVGALLQSFYNGIENIIKQVLAAKSISIPTSSSWHRDLINEATVGYF